jgi:hypothetical protein
VTSCILQPYQKPLKTAPKVRLQNEGNRCGTGTKDTWTVANPIFPLFDR